MFDGIDEKDMNQRFSKLLTEINSDPSRKADFQKDPLPLLAAAGIHLLPTFPTPATGGTPTPAPGVAPKPHLRKGAGGAVGAPGAGGGAVAVPTPGKIHGELNWWGVDIVMDEQFTQDTINGIQDVGSLAGGLTAALGVVASAAVATPIGAALAICVVAKVLEIRLMDTNHTGVHWPVTWPQWGIAALSAPGGPATFAAAAMVWFHPLPN